MFSEDAKGRISPGFSPRDCHEVRAAADAVCAELGLATGELDRRRAVEERIKAAYMRGRRQPLYLVDAGLQA